jgi:hypothetical protein
MPRRPLKRAAREPVQQRNVRNSEWKMATPPQTHEEALTLNLPADV